MTKGSIYAPLFGFFRCAQNEGYDYTTFSTESGKLHAFWFFIYTTATLPIDLHRVCVHTIEVNAATVRLPISYFYE